MVASGRPGRVQGQGLCSGERGEQVRKFLTFLRICAKISIFASGLQVRPFLSFPNTWAMPSQLLFTILIPCDNFDIGWSWSRKQGNCGKYGDDGELYLASHR